MPRKCPLCDHFIPKDASYCKHCAAKLDEAPPPTLVGDESLADEFLKKDREEKKSSAKIILIAVGICIAALIVVSAIVFWPRSHAIGKRTPYDRLVDNYMSAQIDSKVDTFLDVFPPSFTELVDKSIRESDQYKFDNVRDYYKSELKYWNEKLLERYGSNIRFQFEISDTLEYEGQELSDTLHRLEEISLIGVQKIIRFNVTYHCKGDTASGDEKESFYAIYMDDKWYLLHSSAI